MAILGLAIAVAASGCGVSVDVSGSGASAGGSAGTSQTNGGKLYGSFGHLCEKLSAHLLASMGIPASTHDDDQYEAASSVTGEMSACDWDGSQTSGRGLEVAVYRLTASYGVSGAQSQLSEDSGNQKKSLVEHGGQDVVDRRVTGIGQSGVSLYAVTAGSMGGWLSQAYLDVRSENVVIEVEYDDYPPGSSSVIPAATSEHSADEVVQQVLALLGKP